MPILSLAYYKTSSLRLIRHKQAVAVLLLILFQQQSVTPSLFSAPATHCVNSRHTMNLQQRLHPPLRAPKHACRPTTVAVATARSRAVTITAALQLGPFEFVNKEAARDKIRGLLRSTYNGEMILPASEDGQLLLSLLQQHPRAAEKVGAGVSYFSTARRWDHGVATKHFVLHRIDGSSTDFSYLKCLKMAHLPRHQDAAAAAAAAAAASASAAAADVIGAVSADGIYQMDPSSSGTPSSSSSSSRVRRVPHSPQSSSESSSPGSSLQSFDDPTAATSSSSSSSSSSSGWDIFNNNRYNRGFQYNNQDSLRRRAMRVAVAGQLQAYKTAAFAQSLPAELVCPFTGEPLDPENSRAMERDSTSFLQLVDSWLQQQGIGLQDVQVGFREGQPNPYMSSTEQRWSWEDYYQQHAQLQIVSNVGFGRWQNARKGQGLFVGRRSSNSSRGSSSSRLDCSGSPSARRGSWRSSSASDAPASSSGGGSSGGGCGGGASGLGADAAAAVAAAFTTGGTVNSGQQHASSSHRGSSKQAAGELSSSSRSRSGAANASSTSSSSEAVAQPANESAHDSESGSTGSSVVSSSSSSSTVSSRSRRSRRSTQSKGNGMDPAQPSGSAAAAAETTAAAAAVAASGHSASDKDVSADVGAVSRRRRRRA